MGKIYDFIQCVAVNNNNKIVIIKQCIFLALQLGIAAEIRKLLNRKKNAQKKQVMAT